jgi:hypothetical protein
MLRNHMNLGYIFHFFVWELKKMKSTYAKFSIINFNQNYIFVCFWLNEAARTSDQGELTK